MTIRERAEARRKAEAEAAAKGGGEHPRNPPPSPEGERGRIAAEAAPATAGDPQRRLESTSPDLPYGTLSGAGPLHQALTAKAANLCVWLEPPPACQAWLAVRVEESEHLVLILRLPLANRHPAPGESEEIPY